MNCNVKIGDDYEINKEGVAYSKRYLVSKYPVELCLVLRDELIIIDEDRRGNYEGIYYKRCDIGEHDWIEHNEPSQTMRDICDFELAWLRQADIVKATEPKRRDATPEDTAKGELALKQFIDMPSPFEYGKVKFLFNDE